MDCKTLKLHKNMTLSLSLLSSRVGLVLRTSVNYWLMRRLNTGNYQLLRSVWSVYTLTVTGLRLRLRLYNL